MSPCGSVKQKILVSVWRPIIDNLKERKTLFNNYYNILGGGGGGVSFGGS